MPRGCSPQASRLQPYVPAQPCVLEAATPRAQVLDAHNYDASIKLGGTILRRQLLLLLKLRVWEGVNSPRTVREEYVGSFVSCKDLAIASMRDGLQAQ